MEDILVQSFQEVLKSEEFNIPSSPAISARKAAISVLSWYDSNREQAATFLKDIVSTLQTCFSSQSSSIKIRKEYMWKTFYKLRSRDDFREKWKKFLDSSGAEMTPTLYQHVTDSIFDHLVTAHFSKVSTDTKPYSETLDYNEQNALRYVAGYVTRTLYQNLHCSKHPHKEELCLCLAELNDVEPADMEDESSDWMDIIDRGGLKYISNVTYMLFESVELEIRTFIHSKEKSKMNLKLCKDNLLKDDDIMFYWSKISRNWEEERATDLLGMIIDLWIDIRGHSTASAWLEQYKAQKKKTVQKSKGLRKQLISTVPSYSIPNHPED